MTQNKIYKTYQEWEEAQGISPSSPESYYAEAAWNTCYFNLYNKSQLELMALREELAATRAARMALNDGWGIDQQRLKAAEQRGAELEGLLRETIAPLENHFSTKGWELAARIKHQIKIPELVERQAVAKVMQFGSDHRSVTHGLSLQWLVPTTELKDGMLLYTAPRLDSQPAPIVLPEFNDWYVEANINMTRNQIERSSMVWKACVDKTKELNK